MAKALLTHRRDHADARKRYGTGTIPAGDTLIGGIIFCGSAEGREAWIKRLNRHPSRFNSFVKFRDVQSPYALQFGFADWASVDRPYIIH